GHLGHAATLYFMVSWRPAPLKIDLFLYGTECFIVVKYHYMQLTGASVPPAGFVPILLTEGVVRA
ncbi:MAG TPA: hypothetical protein PKN17_04105, partial [Bacillota bacterium]|nr:hypothetical protein [Bacillota bacterium]